MPFHIQTFVTPPFYENTYLLYNDEKIAVLIDPGCILEEERNAILQFIEKHTLKLQYIWLTHAHLDHIFGLRFFSEYFNLKPYLHEQDIPTFDYAYVMAQEMNIPLEKYNGEFHILNEEITFFEEKELIQIIHLPGHSPGGVGFYNKQQHFIFSGDTLFHHSIGRTDLKYANYTILENSIQQKLYKLPDNTIVYCGHNNHTHIGEEKKNNPFIKAIVLN
ncbi:MAG: MBL fold metallo-hydrolase [Chitinophagaceae bacterium]